MNLDGFKGMMIFGALTIWLVSACDFVLQPPPSTKPSGSPSASASPTPSGTPSPRLSPWPIVGWLPEYEQLVKDGMPPTAYGMSNLCPAWWDANKVNQKAVWVKLWKGIIACESSFNRTSRMVETTMSTDPITGKQVASEGLTQLSYQDVPNYKGTDCEQISWAKDKSLKDNDPNKTIFDPIINLRCAMAIARKVMAAHPDGGKYGTGLGEYWSCSRPGKKGILLFQASAPECAK